MWSISVICMHRVTMSILVLPDKDTASLANYPRDIINLHFPIWRRNCLILTIPLYDCLVFFQSFSVWTYFNYQQRCHNTFKMQQPMKETFSMSVFFLAVTSNGCLEKTQDNSNVLFKNAMLVFYFLVQHANVFNVSPWLLLLLMLFVLCLMLAIPFISVWLVCVLKK